MSVLNGLGFTVELAPVAWSGTVTKHDLSKIMPEGAIFTTGDTVGWTDNGRGKMWLPYFALALKVSYLARIHKNIFIQPEAGIKFVPYAFSAKDFNVDDDPPSDYLYYRDYFNSEAKDVAWLREKLSVSQKSYIVPDVTVAINFIVHGKKPQHCFIFGINANIGLVDRISSEYNTTAAIPAKLQSSGKYSWRSSYIGFHVGYQFMKAKKAQRR